MGETPSVRARLSMLSRAPGGSEWFISMSMTTSLTSLVRGRRSASRLPASLARIASSMSFDVNESLSTRSGRAYTADHTIDFL